eukprot:7270783-Prymnesium_polylepis.1
MRKHTLVWHACASVQSRACAFPPPCEPLPGGDRDWMVGAKVRTCVRAACALRWLEAGTWVVCNWPACAPGGLFSTAVARVAPARASCVLAMCGLWLLCKDCHAPALVILPGG